jgi:putative SOS response-associated peptidase YedK
MCGRYVQSKPVEEIKHAVPFDRAECDLTPRYNIAPAQMAPVLVHTGDTVLKQMRWGLIPSWAKGEEIGSRLINARAETVREKPAYRHAFKRRRCLVLADSFYEWQPLPGTTRRQPMRIWLQSEEPFLFAGLWETWPRPDGVVIESYSIVTCRSNDLLRPIHDRMPVILNARDYAPWLDPKNERLDELARLLVPYSGEELTAHPVSLLVNNPKIDDSRCIQPVV